MLYINIKERARRLSFYLAMEEYVAGKGYADDCFFTWIVEPSVIFGRNQLIDTEVNVEYCRLHNIAMYRRKSGGGCVYSDLGNLMMSYITTERSTAFTFYRYMNFIALALRKLGIEATVTGRNDILVDGRKVSGNAFYYSHGHSIAHGTLLYDTQMENMLNAITPPMSKLQSNGVSSVRQRITLLKEYTNLSLDEIRTAIRQTLCTDTIQLTEDDESEITEMERYYLQDSFIFGKNPRHSLL